MCFNVFLVGFHERERKERERECEACMKIERGRRDKCGGHTPRDSYLQGMELHVERNVSGVFVCLYESDAFTPLHKIGNLV